MSEAWLRYYRRMNTVYAQVMKNSYFGLSLPTHITDPLREAWAGEIGREYSESLASNKESRDGTSALHITVIEPREFRHVRELQPLVVEDLVFHGVGEVRNDKGHVAHFLVVSSNTIDRYRERLGLEPKDLHATLGFDPKDVHGVSKGVATVFHSF